MVTPQLEYASDVWDPHYVGDIMKLEKVQLRVALWVLNDYDRFSSVSSMLNQLSWPTIQSGHKLSRLHTLHKVFYHRLYIPPETGLETPNTHCTAICTPLFY